MNKGKKLNWKQACGLLGCSKSWFYSLVRLGTLPVYAAVGKKRGFWVWEEDVLALIKRKSGA